jgi:chaperone modulatory protein CbpM
MEPHILILSFQECSTRFGLSTAELHDFLQAGLLRPAPDPDAVLVEEPEDLFRLARLHHELGLPPEALDVVQAMRRQLLQLQAALARETARARQLEQFLQGGGPMVEI